MLTLGTLAPHGGVNDPFFSNVALLLHGDGSNGSTTFTDSSSHHRSISLGGNAQISTAQFKFGGASMLFDGTGDWAFSSGNTTSTSFTVECFYYTGLGSTATYYLFDIGNYWKLRSVPADGAWRLYRDVTGGYYATTGTPTTNTWTHIALVLTSTTMKLYQNGNLIATDTDNFPAPNGNVTLATDDAHRNTGTGKYNGYIDDFRYTVGTARYNSNFTPPVAAYPNS